MTFFNYGTLVALSYGFLRSPHWSVVEAEFRANHPYCVACSDETPKPIQVHHINPFHYVKAVGRDDLELDLRNLISLCETEANSPAQNHHLEIGHLGNFQEGNLLVAEDAAGRYHGLSEVQIKADPDWQNEERVGRLKALDLMSHDELIAFRARLDAELPPDPALCAKYNIIIIPFV